MRHHTNRAVAFLLIAGAIVSAAQTRSQDEPNCNQHRARRVEITDSDATILGFKIGSASLADVQARLGGAKIVRVSREEESDIAICYVSPSDGTVLVFYSGAMGGWKDITRFAVWSQTAAYPRVSRCTPSTRVSQSLSTQSGLRIGLTRSQVKGIAGAPSASEGSSVSYDYLCREKMTNEEIERMKTANPTWNVTSYPYFDKMSWIKIRFANARAARIEVGKIESY